MLGRDASPDPDISASPQLSSDDCTTANLPDEILQKFRGQSREDLIEMVCFLQRTVECQGKKLADLAIFPQPKNFLGTENSLFYVDIILRTPKILLFKKVQTQTITHLNALLNNLIDRRITAL